MTTEVLDAARVARRLEGAPDAPFWHALGEGELRLPRCAGCQGWTWPARPACPRCHSLDFEWEGVEPVGVVYSWTRTWYPFVSVRADELPYVVVVVELPGAGDSRVLGVLRGAEDGLAIGRRVTGEIVAAAANSYDLPSLVWRLAEGPT